MNRQYGAISGAAIALIVLNHAIHFGLQASPVHGTWLAVLTVLQALGAFAVPAFLFISGAFLSYAARELSFTFVKSSLERILWPYLIWSVLFYVLVFVVGGVRYSILECIKNLLVGFPYHFVPLLIFWYLAAPLVIRAGRRHATWLLTGIASYQLLLLLLRFPDFTGVHVRLPDWLRLVEPPVLFVPMSDWAIYFPLGLVLSLHATALKGPLLKVRGLMVSATAVLFLLGLLNASNAVAAPWARFVAPLPLMFLLPVIDREAIPLARNLEVLGRRSYGLYLTHFVVITMLAVLAGSSVLHLTSPVIVYPAFLILTLGISLFLMNVAAKSTTGRRIYRYVFGIVPPIVARPSPRRPQDVPVTVGR